MDKILVYRNNYVLTNKENSKSILHRSLRLQKNGFFFLLSRLIFSLNIPETTTEATTTEETTTIKQTTTVSGNYKVIDSPGSE